MEGYYQSIGARRGTAPKPKAKPAGFVFAIAMAGILLVITWAMAQPSSSSIYRPELLLLY
jgi:hypothetical protein